MQGQGWAGEGWIQGGYDVIDEVILLDDDNLAWMRKDNYYKLLTKIIPLLV